MVKSTGAVMMVMLSAASAFAQQSPQDRPPDSARARTQILQFEGALRQAVLTGAAQMSVQVRRVVPNAGLMLAGSTEVSGYRLDGYGAFFVVRVPGMRSAYVSALQVLASQQLLRGPRTPAPGTVTATTVADRPPDTAAPPPPQPAPFVDPALVTDPDSVYTREVKNALVEAMLENSGPLRIGANEFLTVAAKDSAQPDPLVPTSQSDFHTLLFTFKGSDLADYREGRITADEAKRRVAIKED